jgi:hypothetical protein
MRGLIDDRQPADGWFREVLLRLTLAGRWREAGRACPDAADALGRAADRQGALAGALLTQNMEMSAHGPNQGMTVGARTPRAGGLTNRDVSW